MSKNTVLIVDDDPTHLRLYTWVVQKAGHLALPCQVTGGELDLPQQPTFDVSVLDYKLGTLTAENVARRLKSIAPDRPIIVMSDMMWMPDDVAPYAAGFVRKGEPEQLLDLIAEVLANSPR